MADFCNKCAHNLFGPNCEPDIDVLKIAEELEPGHVMKVICEGCRLAAVIKNEDCTIGLAFYPAEDDEMPHYESLETWQKS